MSKRDVSPKIKEPRKQSKKPKKKHRFFYRKQKQNQDQWLLYVTHQKNQYTHLGILLRHLDVSRKKKSNSKYGTGNHLIVHHPKNGSKKQPEPLN